jgi:hypothetical protein
MDLREARQLLASLRPRVEQFLLVRADLAELQADLAENGSSPRGAFADTKGLQARLYAELEHFAREGAQVKGFAPLLLDFEGDRNGVPVLWCWLEGDLDITWYHRLDTGFAGRRPIQ